MPLTKLSPSVMLVPRDEPVETEFVFEGVAFIFRVLPVGESSGDDLEFSWTGCFQLEVSEYNRNVSDIHVIITQEMDNGGVRLIIDQVVGGQRLLLDEWKPWNFRKVVNLEYRKPI